MTGAGGHAVGSASTTTGSATRCGSTGACSTCSPGCTGTRPCGSWSTRGRRGAGPDRRAHPARRGHVGGLPGPARGGRVSSDLESADEVRRRFDDHDYLADEGSRRPSSSRSGSGCRCCWRASRGSARRRPPRSSRGRWTRRWSGCSATRGSPPARRCTTGTTSASCWPSGAESQHQPLTEADLFSEQFLVERPILRCVRYDGPRPPVLLIDEVDRADDEFEALLLEALGEGSVTVPELGTFTAKRSPIVVLTSNRSRELHDALRRRCLYHWLEYPSPSGSWRSCGARPVGEHRADRVGREVRRARPLARRRQAARRGRGDQLGGGALRPRRHRAGARRGRPHARRRGEDPGRP